jgi:hypothetical protein
MNFMVFYFYFLNSIYWILVMIFGKSEFLLLLLLLLLLVYIYIHPLFAQAK